MNQNATDKNAKETLLDRLRRLHQEHTRALRDLCADQDRKLEEAFHGAMADMTAIEREANDEIRQVCEEYRKSEEGSAQPGTPGAAYWDAQKRISEITIEARKKADAARGRYLERWKDADAAFVDVRQKAARDFLARVHDAWRTADLGAADAATVDELVRTLTVALAC